MKHPYWGEIEQKWAGFSSDIHFSHPFFGDKEIEVFLNDEYDEDYEEIEEPPSSELLNELENTYKNFLDHFSTILQNIQIDAFDRYIKLYAHYFENSEESGEPALNIDTIEKHNAYIKDVGYLRVSKEKTIKIIIHYGIDEEHGLEFKLINGQIEKIGGIADT